MLAHFRVRVGIARHDQRAVDRVLIQKTVDDRQCGEDPARPIGHVKREGVVRLCVWYFGLAPMMSY